MENLINIANVLFILSYFVQDLLRIRFFTVIGSALILVHFYIQPEPIMTIIYWNLFFIALNLAQVGRILGKRRTGMDPMRNFIAALRSRIDTMAVVFKSRRNGRITPDRLPERSAA